MKNIFFIFFLISAVTYSQIKIDTSYTVNSTYNKEIKKYPFIKKVDRPFNPSIKQIKDIVYNNIEGRILNLDAYFLNAKSVQPAVILIHGGGWKSGNKSQMHYIAQEIAAKGYSCFNVEYRLSPEAKYPAGIKDVKSAIKYIKQNAHKFNVDGTKIAVLGCSSGGQMASLIGVTNGNIEFEDSNLTQSSNVQAVINMDGVLAFNHPESEEANAAALWLGGSVTESPETWKQASALTHCTREMPPVLFVNSDKPRFHAGRDDMIVILNKYNIYSELKTINNSPHSFWFFEPWFDEIVEYSTNFLNTIFKQK